LYTATHIPFADANQRLTNSTNFTWNGYTLNITPTTQTGNTFIRGGNTTGTGNNNVAVGSGALASFTTGFQNFALGTQVLENLTTGLNNVGIGRQALRGITTSANNVGIGSEALWTEFVSGDNNVGIGTRALGWKRLGGSDVGIGFRAGHYSRTGSFNTFIGNETGPQAAVDSLSGSNNTIVGGRSAQAMFGAASGNLVLGDQLALPTLNGSNQVVIKNLIFGTGASGTGTTIQAASRVGVKVAAPVRGLHVNAVIRSDSLATFSSTTTQLVGATAGGDLAGITVGSGLTLTSGTLTASSGVSDGDKGDIDVTSSGAVWTVDTNAITTVKINDAAVTEAKLANGAAGNAKLGGLTYISADDVDVNLSSYLSTDWIAVYSQLVVWLRIGNTASRTITFPTPSSTYQGKVVEIFFGATNAASHFGQITTATNRFTYKDGGNVATATTYDGGGDLSYLRIICAQDPNTLAYQWLILDQR
jgi:hypothetical protein